MTWLILLALTPPIIIAYYVIFSDKFTEENFWKNAERIIIEFIKPEFLQ